MKNKVKTHVLSILFVLTGIVILWKLAYGANIQAPTAFSVTAKAPQNTSLYCTWVLPPMYGQTGYPDSSDVVWFSGSDTLFVGNVTPTSTLLKTLTGLIPNTKYVLGLRIRRGDSTEVSAKDSLFTASQHVENTSDYSPSTFLRGARAWLPSAIKYDSLYVVDTGLDSTMIYMTAPYVAIQAKGIGDSCKVLLSVFNGHAEETNLLRLSETFQANEFNFRNTVADTMNVMTSAWTKPKLLNIDSGDHFYVRATGLTDNGHATKLLLRLYRRDQ